MRSDVQKPMQVNFSVYFPKCVLPNTLHVFYSVVICIEQFKKLSSSNYYTSTLITLENDYTVPLQDTNRHGQPALKGHHRTAEK